LRRRAVRVGVQQILRRVLLGEHPVREVGRRCSEQPVHRGGLLVEHPWPARQVAIARNVAIATAPNAAERRRLIAALARSDAAERALHLDLEDAKRDAEASYRFALMTLARTEQHGAATLVFFARRYGHLSDDRRRYTLSAEDIRLINPNTRTCAVFRSSADAELTKRIYSRIPVLIDESKGLKAMLGRQLHDHAAYGQRQRPVPHSDSVGQCGCQPRGRELGLVR